MHTHSNKHNRCCANTQALEKQQEEERSKHAGRWKALEAKARSNPLAKKVQLKAAVYNDSLEGSDMHGPVRMPGDPSSVQTGVRRKSVLPYHESTLQALSSYTGHSLEGDQRQ